MNKDTVPGLSGYQVNYINQSDLRLRAEYWPLTEVEFPDLINGLTISLASEDDHVIVDLDSRM